MRSFAKHKLLRLLMVFVFVMVFCVVAVTEERAAVTEEMTVVGKDSEVRTTLEQRMLKKISVDFKNTPIEDVLRIMAEQADVDIVKSPKVTGVVTTTLTNVPLEEALSNILATHGFGYVADKNMLRILPVAELAEPVEKLVSRIYRITYADVVEVEAALGKFISARGSLSSNRGTSNIIVTDTDRKINAIDKFIEEVDRITPQILVEARIYDITSQNRLDLGVEWQAGRNTDYAPWGPSAGVGSNPADDRDPFMTGAFAGATSETSGTTGAFRFGWLNSGIDIDVLLRAQQNNIDAKLLANPRILVLDNETAQIKIITEKPYIELTETSGGGSMGTTAFKEIGVELEVTPHFTRDEMVRLQLKPMFSVETGTVNIGAPGGQVYPQPVVDTREAETTLLVKHGRTVVLGGLRKKEVRQQINKVPLLGDLPVVGMLFRFEGEDTVTSEIVVFITPWIVEDAVMSEEEQQQFEVTEFSGPENKLSRAETGEE